MSMSDIDGKLSQGWGGKAPNGCHVNVLLARRGSPTAAGIAQVFTSPSSGFTPILACLGPDQPSYVTVNPPTVILNKTPAVTDLEQSLVSGAAQVGISQGVLDAVAEDLLEADQETVVLVSLWIDPEAADETEVRHSSREATLSALREAVNGQGQEDRLGLVGSRESVTHPFYNGN
ncbi:MULTISPECIES: formaldehyde-activating enzyme [Micrococcaceae]|uniref:formaldehyde-activating enzyme n=1 Tax=unclassified Kocuria TaxID=2649579 RepID=UPI00101038AD|nr:MULTISPECIES: formaldehyde-activating enzyme [unclassified Kocuria]